MRKKAEKKIRQAVSELDNTEYYRLDQVRAGAGLHPKVFDKTILDMHRVGTIELFTGSTDDMSRAQISNLVRQGKIIYVNFRFIDGSTPENSEADLDYIQTETVVVILDSMIPGEWARFDWLCELNEGKRAEKKIEEIIRDYIQKNA